MDAPGPSDPIADGEREHLERAHHELCTALTVLVSNVALVRIHLRDAPLSEHGIPVHAHLTELEGAVERIQRMAGEMKRWHDGLAPHPAASRLANSTEVGEVPARSSS